MVPVSERRLRTLIWLGTLLQTCSWVPRSIRRGMVYASAGVWLRSLSGCVLLELGACRMQASVSSLTRLEVCVVSSSGCLYGERDCRMSI